MKLTVYVNCEDLKKAVDMFDGQGLAPRYAEIDFSYEQGDSYNYYDVGLSVELGDLLKDNKLQINDERYIKESIKKDREKISFYQGKIEISGSEKQEFVVATMDDTINKLAKALEDAVNNSKRMG